MRLNKFIAEHTRLSRRKADVAIAEGRVKVNGVIPQVGTVVSVGDTVTLDGRNIVTSTQATTTTTVLLHKPIGYVCSANGQGSPTVYSLLPNQYRQLNIAGRLDKDSSGLVILTNDGDLLYELTHPSQNKTKVYTILLDKELSGQEIQSIKTGVDIGDERPSTMDIVHTGGRSYQVTLHEGRNRQVRRTFKALGIQVQTLHRTSLGPYSLNSIESKRHAIV